MVIKSGKATPTAQAVIKLYGIEPSAYEVKPAVAETEATTSDNKQLTIDDLLEPDAKTLLKDLIKEAITETLNSIVCNEITANYDAKYQTYNISLKIRREALITTKPESIKAKHAGEVKGAGDKWAI